MSSKTRKIKLLYICTKPVVAWWFLRGQNQFLNKRGFELHLATSPGQFFDEVPARDSLVAHEIVIAREISFFADLATLFRLIVLLRRVRPHMVHVSNAKASFLGAFAAWVTRVPVRIFLCRGLATDNASGLKREIFRQIERLTATLCHQTICVSPSLLQFARRERILKQDAGIVIAKGMSNGIDTQRFAPDCPACWDKSKQLDQSLGLLNGAQVIGFVGRLAKDKGIHEIAQAWTLIKDEFPRAHLLFVGYWEPDFEPSDECRNSLESDSRVHFAGFVDDVAPWYKLMSVMVLPSHGTEGFTNAIMEASAMGIPVIATNVVGCVDGVVDGVTGMLVPPRDPNALAERIKVYLENPELAVNHGRAGRERVLRCFRQEIIWDGLLEEYKRLLKEKGLPEPLSMVFDETVSA